MKRNWKSSLLGIAGTLLVVGGAALSPQAAQAGADGRKNTTIGLGAAAAYALLHHQTLAGVALGAGTVIAEKKYEDARRSERNTKNRQYYYNGSPYGSYNNNNNYPYNNNNRHYNNNGYNNSQDAEQYGGYDPNQRYGNGKKKGWNGRNMPPGQWKKYHGGKQQKHHGDDSFENNNNNSRDNDND